MSPKALSQRLQCVTIPEEPTIQAEWTYDEFAHDSVGVGYRKRTPDFRMPKPLIGDEYACSCTGSFSLGAGSECVEHRAMPPSGCEMSPRAFSQRLQCVNIPYDPGVQAEWTYDDFTHDPYEAGVPSEWTYDHFFHEAGGVSYSTQTPAFTMLQPSGGDECSCTGYTSGSDCGSPSSRQTSRSMSAQGADWKVWPEWVKGKKRDSPVHFVFRSVDVVGYRTRAPIFKMPRAPVGDESELPMSPQASRSSVAATFMMYDQDVARTILRRIYAVAALGHVEAGAPCIHAQTRRVAGCLNDDVIHGGLHAPLAVVLEEEMTSADELTGVGGVVAEKYFLSVQLGDRIPMETGAARVNSSRLETGPEWRDFLRHSVEYDFNDCLPLDAMLQCPCCLGILRRPVGLPCGHSFCRGCLMRLMPSAAEMARRCPLCRAAIPQMRLHVNEPLDAVSEALHVYLTMRKRGREGVAAAFAEAPLAEVPPLTEQSVPPQPFVPIAFSPEPLSASSAIAGDLTAELEVAEVSPNTVAIEAAVVAAVDESL